MTSKKNEHVFKGLLKTDKYEYKLTINTSQLTKNGETVVYSRYFNLGAYTSESGEKKTCVDIYVMYPEFKKEIPNANYKIANLITTHYNEKCSVNEKLERGEGTQHIISTAMYFVYKMCPFIDGFAINDASTRQCDNNTTIILSYFSITKYGKTWYENNFKAYIEDNEKKEKYRNIILEIFRKELPEWEIFNVMFLRNVNKDIIKKLEDIYKISKTYNSLFKNIHNEGIITACIYFQPWIEKLMLTTDLRNYVMFTQWIIPIESIKRIRLLIIKKNFQEN
jgi:hypothetical protein